MSFEQLGLNEDILKSIKELGFETPSEIQLKSIPKLLVDDTDLIALAQTGTGKTAAFGLPILQKIDNKLKFPQAVIVSPTRELCLQISSDLKIYSKYIPNIYVTAIYGGSDIVAQFKEIERGVQIIVATPGRLVDMIRRRKLNMSNVETLVLDEADEMLKMGFKDELDTIIDSLPEEKNTWLFSATMSKEIRSISKEYLNKPFEITVGTQNSSSKNITHNYYIVDREDKYFTLKRILDYYPNMYAIVFCNTKSHTQRIAEKLTKDNYNSDALHGDLTQDQRELVMNRFRKKNIQILVATDVAARGIDVDDITHVINFDIPESSENYTHRSGRTGRANKSGISIVLSTKKDYNKMVEIEKNSKINFNFLTVPKTDDICENQINGFIDKIEKEVAISENIDKYIHIIEDRFSNISKEVLIKRILSLEIAHILEYYNNMRNIRDDKFESRNKGNDRNNNRDESKNRNISGKADPIILNIGSNTVTNKGHLLRILCTLGKIKSSDIGRISIQKNRTIVDINPRFSGKFLNEINDKLIEGKTVKASRN